ncbi:MAG: STAS domain-containing protein [Candidatus Promineifilaceae bacterium]|nr:STAS domain-containing protein [Candidatus Promineifilaceae bacterium]
MTTANVTMHVRQAAPNASVVEINGEITAYAENALMDAYTQASNGETSAIILDFSNLEYMNSSGIGLLVTLLIRANRRNQQVLAVGLNEHYQQIFELTRLNEAIAIHESEGAALASLN